jgi:hypothetical protein
MSDRAPVTLTIYDVENHQSAIRDLLTTTYNFSPVNPPYDIPDTLESGVAYENAEMELNTPMDIARELEALGVPFVVSQEAKHDYDAVALYYTKELGLRECIAGQDGRVLVSARDIMRVIDENPHAPSALQAVEDLCARPLILAIDALDRQCAARHQEMLSTKEE